MPRLVPVELHARAADLAGARVAEIELAAGATAADVKAALAARHPGLAELLTVSVVATERDYLADGGAVGDAARLHLVPPVSGG